MSNPVNINHKRYQAFVDKLFLVIILIIGVLHFGIEYGLDSLMAVSKGVAIALVIVMIAATLFDIVKYVGRGMYKLLLKQQNNLI